MSEAAALVPNPLLSLAFNLAQPAFRSEFAMKHFYALLVLIGNYTGELPDTFTVELIKLLSRFAEEHNDVREQNNQWYEKYQALRQDYAYMESDRNHYRDQTSEYAQRLAAYRAKTHEEDAIKAFNWLVANEQFAWDEVKKSTLTNKFIQLIKVVRKSEDPPMGLAASKDAAEKFLTEVRPNPNVAFTEHSWFQTNPADLKALREKLTGSSES